MGSRFGTVIVDENTSPKKINAMLDNWYSANCDHEEYGDETNSEFIPNPSRPKLLPSSEIPVGGFANAEDAKQALENYYSKAGFDCLYTKFTEYPESAALKKAEQRYWDAVRKYRERSDKVYYTPETVKSKYITCKCCGSKLSVEHLVRFRNNCPLCREDLRPQSELASVMALGKKVNEAEAAVQAEKRKKTGKGKVKIMYLIRAHC